MPSSTGSSIIQSPSCSSNTPGPSVISSSDPEALRHVQFADNVNDGQFTNKSLGQSGLPSNEHPLHRTVPDYGSSADAQPGNTIWYLNVSYGNNFIMYNNGCNYE